MKTAANIIETTKNSPCRNFSHTTAVAGSDASPALGMREEGSVTGGVCTLFLNPDSKFLIAMHPNARTRTRVRAHHLIYARVRTHAPAIKEDHLSKPIIFRADFLWEKDFYT